VNLDHLESGGNTGRRRDVSYRTVLLAAIDVA